jgi:hypothetical protein
MKRPSGVELLLFKVLLGKRKTLITVVTGIFRRTFGVGESIVECAKRESGRDWANYLAVHVGHLPMHF